MFNFISSLSVLIAALTFITGVFTWKREFVGKRRIELAESVLAMFYEAEDIIKQIRNPGSFIGEGKTRKREENELKKDSELLDRAYIVIERYQKREMLFSQIRSLRYRVKAMFGTPASEPFDELDKLINEIFSAAQMLGTHYWPREGRVEMAADEFKKHLEEKHLYEKTIWYMGEENDTVTPRVKEIIANIENILQDAFVSQDNFAASALDDIKDYVRMWIRVFKKQEPNK